MRIDLPVLDAVGTHYGPTAVEARQFFLSFNSVMTLAYSSFSQTLLNVKAHVESAMHGTLRPENPGSKWPKTTLGCLIKDETPSEDEIHILRDTCSRFTEQLRALSEDDKRAPIGELKVVVFGCRTLEKRLLSLAIRLNATILVDDKPPVSHIISVQEVMAQFDASQHRRYYRNLHPKGRTCDAYYRQEHVEATLIADVCLSDKVKNIINAFTAEVDTGLPGLYEWFDQSSWHLTVRALVPKE